MNWNEQLRQSVIETRNRRKEQVIITRSLKIDFDKCNKRTKFYFDRIFDEAKWIKNDSLYRGNVDPNKALKEVTVRYKKNNEWYTEVQPILVLPSQSQMLAKKELTAANRSLDSKKFRGKNAGEIKFFKEVNSIHYLQSHTYKLKRNNDNIITHVQLAKNKQWLKVSGGKQIQNVDEIISIKLIRKPSGMYINVMFCIHKDRLDEWYNSFRKDKVTELKEVCGVDLGIKTTCAVSDNEFNQNRFNYNIRIADPDYLNRTKSKLKRSLKAIKRTEKYKNDNNYRSNNYIKLLHEYNKCREKVTYKKKTKAQQLVGYLKNNYKIIAFQDELLTGWFKESHFKKYMMQSALGTIKANLKYLVTLGRAVMVSSNMQTTNQCPCCDHQTNTPLENRTFICDNCGFSDNRDFKSADMMIKFAGFKLDTSKILNHQVKSFA